VFGKVGSQEIKWTSLRLMRTLAQVVKGMDVVRAVEALPTGKDDKPKQKVSLLLQLLAQWLMF